jgi:Na+-translocating ferredoxin:NAD+ oxidoreductase RnfD subunit
VFLVALGAGGAVEVAFSLSLSLGVGLGQKRPLTVTEGLIVIALLYSLLLPPGLSLWIVALGAAVAILSRELFGGLGRNVFHPALVGKATLLVLFPAVMTSRWAEPVWGGWGGCTKWAPPPEAATALTPLIAARQGELEATLGQLWLGSVPGALGTTSGLLMLLAGALLLLTRAADWRISLGMIATVGLGEWLFEMLAPATFGGGWGVHLLSGSLLFTAFLIATDPVTSPMTRRGKWIYAIAIGLLVLILRGLTPDPEGVTFSVLMANAFVPLIDRWTVPKSFGGVR